jgi:hypothetical protein
LCAQFARIETGSDYRSPSGQFTVPSAEVPTRPVAVPLPRQTDHLTSRQSQLGIQLPTSMPLAIQCPASTPLIAVSHWPGHPSSSEHVYHTDAPYYPFDFPFEDMPADTPSNSFQSEAWSGAIEFQHQGRTEEDLLSSFTAPSSFDITTQHLSVPASFSSPQVISPQVVSPHVYTHGQPGYLSNSTPFDQLDEEGSYAMASLPDTNMSGWAQGAYNVSDRTNFGGLAHPPIAPPGIRKRRASHSRAGSSAGLSCEACGRVFPSKAERE